MVLCYGEDNDFEANYTRDSLLCPKCKKIKSEQAKAHLKKLHEMAEEEDNEIGRKLKPVTFTEVLIDGKVDYIEKPQEAESER